MVQVTWTDQALDDIDGIANYHSQKSSKYAQYLVESFFATEPLLEKFPYLGRIVPDTNITSIRELIVHNYRVIYSVPDPNLVHILAVRHSSILLKEFPIDPN